MSTKSHLTASPKNNSKKSFKIHIWKVRNTGYENLINRHNWSKKSGFREKSIRGRVYMQFITEECKAHKVVKFIPKDVFWNIAHNQNREVELVETGAAMYGISIQP